MIIDILQIIINYSHIRDQIKCMTIDTHLYQNINIYSLKHNVDLNLSQNVIEQRKFRKLKKLSCGMNKKIYDVNHLADTLKILKCPGYCGIDQNGISQLKCLEILHCMYNYKIYDVNHLENTLKELFCNGGCCGIDQSGISKLRHLRIIKYEHNKKINNINLIL